MKLGTWYAHRVSSANKMQTYTSVWVELNDSIGGGKKLSTEHLWIFLYYWSIKCG